MLFEETRDVIDTPVVTYYVGFFFQVMSFLYVMYNAIMTIIINNTVHYSDMSMSNNEFPCRYLFLFL